MIRLIVFALLSAFISQTLMAQSWTPVNGSNDKARLIIMADMGNEPDEEQQMMHLMMYASEFDLEGLIAVTGKYLGPHMKDPIRQVLYPQLFDHIIDGYAKVYKNLRLHNENYPEPSSLYSIVASGQTGYGSESIGEGLSSEGSELFIKAFEKDDPRPLVIVVNAGSNTLAQALLDYSKTHSKAELEAVISRLRVIENGAQDDSGAYICHNYPGIYWVRSNYQAYCYGGPAGNSRVKDGSDEHKNELGPYTWEPYVYSGLGQHQWALEHIIGGHGPFGACWPLRQFSNGAISFVEGGGTVPWLCTINRGLSDVNNFHWGGWSGRYSQQKQVDYMSKHESVSKDEHRYKPFLMFGEGTDRWVDPETQDVYENIYTPIWRWRRAFFNDFKYRMDWCVQPFEKANHNPTAVIGSDKSDAILTCSVKAGTTFTIDASASFDVDGDELYFSWYNYKEAGTFPGDITLASAEGSVVSVSIPQEAKGTQVHIILELRDGDYQEALFDYRRLIIEVEND